jgi:deoxycytidylate deaminase
MKYLKSLEKQTALKYLELTAKQAQKSTCLRSKCGSIIIKDNKIIGIGFNSPPGNLKSQQRCLLKNQLSDKFKSDKTCCVHAEQRAIMDALAKNPRELKGSRLYFIRLDKDDKMKYAGKPYCTICSKMSLDVGIAEFVLFHKEGICVYNTEEYNDLSFSF